MRPLRRGTLHPLSGAIGRSAMMGRITLLPSAFRRSDVSRDRAHIGSRLTSLLQKPDSFRPSQSWRGIEVCRRSLST